METRYVVNPEKCMEIDNTGSVAYKQAQIYCRDCEKYQNLTFENQHASTPSFDLKRSTY